MNGSFLVAAALAAASLRALSAMQSEPEPVAVVSYTVEEGDSLWTISKKIDPDGDPRAGVARLMELNDLTSGGVYPGLILQIPTR